MFFLKCNLKLEIRNFRMKLKKVKIVTKKNLNLRNKRFVYFIKRILEFIFFFKNKSFRFFNRELVIYSCNKILILPIMNNK